METTQSIEKALILFAHGARDPRWAEPFVRLREKVAAQFSGPVVLAYLELMPPSLPIAVSDLVQQGCKSICIVPIFFGQGGHIRRDLPTLIEQLQKEHPQLELRVAQAAGEDDVVLLALAQYCLRQC